MAKFEAGNPGRKKGSQNKVPREVKTMILQALDKAGGVAYLTRQAKANPVAFMALLGRVLPLQVKGELQHSGEVITRIELVPLEK